MTKHSPVSSASSMENMVRLYGWRLFSILTGLLLTLFLSTLDATIVGTALPRIVADLHGFDQYSWVVTGLSAYFNDHRTHRWQTFRSVWSQGVPLFMQDVLGQTASSSGAGLTPFFIPVAISAALGGQVIAKVGRYHFLAVIGALVLLAGLFLLVHMDTTTALGTVTLNMIVVGPGIGMLQPIYTLAGQNAIPPQRLGAGTGAMTYLRAMGSLIGTAVLGAIVTHSITGERSAHFSLAGRQALAMSIEHAFLVTFGVSVAVFMTTLFLKDIPLSHGHRSVHHNAA